MCNHCPFVKHLRGGLAQLARDCQARGVAMVGINSNDVANYPADSPAKMKEEAKSRRLHLSLSLRRNAGVAKAYRAACTPDFFLFDRASKLVYRGQFDDSRPGNGLPVTGKDLRAALDAVLAGKPVPPTKCPASAATSNGSPATSRIILGDEACCLLLPSFSPSPPQWEERAGVRRPLFSS